MKNHNRIFYLVLLCGTSFSAFSQNVGINTTGATPSTNAILDLNSGNSRNLGVILPCVTLGTSLATFNGPIAHAATTADSGMMVFNSSSAHQAIGYYYWNGSSWVSLGGTGAGTSWSLTGNAGTTPGTNYLGTSDGEALEFKTDGQKAGWLDYASPYNTCLGYQTMNSLGASATHCTALGYQAMGGSSGSPSDIAVGYYALYSSNNATGHNIAIGDSALSQNSNPANTIAIGHQAMSSNNSGTGYDVGIGYQVMTGVASSTAAHDVGIGYQALYEQQSNYNIGIGEQTLYYGSAQYSVALGYQAFGSPTYSASPLYSIGIGYQALYGGSKATGGSNDIAIGYQAMYGVGAGNNIAIGYQAFYGNGSTTGTYNIAMGYQSLYSITTGGYNIAIGDSVLKSGTSTKGSTAVGDDALASNATGYFNTAVGYQALQSDVSVTTSAGNTAVGASALSSNTTGSDNAALGYEAGNYNTSGQQNTYLGYNAGNNASLTTFSNVICLGYNSGNGAATIGSNSIYLGNSTIAHLYCAAASITTYSDRRVKDSIKENVPGLAFITKLRPVTYHLNIHKENKILGIKDDQDYPGKYDIEKITQTGFIAQQVDSAAQACGYDFSGIDKPKTPNSLYALNYTTFVVPLVKAVQEQQQMIEEHAKTIDELKEEIELLKQKVDAMPAMSSSVPSKK